MSKVRYPQKLAKQVWEELSKRLSPHASRIAYAGSLRRGKPDVGDLEILFVPTVGANCLDLFAASNIDAELELLLAEGVIRKRPTIAGAMPWGPKNKLGVHVASGLPVDFFATTEESWHGYMVCRTGGKQNNILIAQNARAKGWTWNSYDGQLTKLTRARGEDGELEERQVHKINSERELYAFVGMPYIEPWNRE